MGKRQEKKTSKKHVLVFFSLTLNYAAQVLERTDPDDAEIRPAARRLSELKFLDWNLNLSACWEID